MDNLASMNIIPFMGLLNLIKVKYLDTPEVFRTMITILCDFNPQYQECVNRTKRYIQILLGREPDLAQCLITFLDESHAEQQNSTESSISGSVPPAKKDEYDTSPLSQTQVPLSDLSQIPVTGGHFHSAPDKRLPQSSSFVQPQQLEEKSRQNKDANSQSNSFAHNYRNNNELDEGTRAKLNPTNNGNGFSNTSTSNPECFTHNIPTMIQMDNCHPDVGEKVPSHISIPQFLPLVELRQGGLFPTAAWITQPGTQQQLAFPMTLPYLVSAPFVPSACIRLPTMEAFPSVSTPSSVSATSSCETKFTSPIDKSFSGIQAHLMKDSSVLPVNTCSTSASSSSELSKSSMLSSLGTSVNRPASAGISGTTQSTESKQQIHYLPDKDGTCSSTLYAPITAVTTSIATSTIDTVIYKSPMTTTVHSSASAASSPTLSRLFGQPSIAIPGTFTDKRHCIVGAPKINSFSEKKSLGTMTTLASQVKITKASKSSSLISTKTKENAKGMVSSVVTVTSSNISKNLAGSVISKTAFLKGIADSDVAMATSNASKTAVSEVVIVPVTTSTSSMHNILQPSQTLPQNTSHIGSVTKSNLTSRNKFHTVQVMLGSKNSLAAFPYIQQMVLPDGQTSSISLNPPSISVNILNEKPLQSVSQRALDSVVDLAAKTKITGSDSSHLSSLGQKANPGLKSHNLLKHVEFQKSPQLQNRGASTTVDESPTGLGLSSLSGNPKTGMSISVVEPTSCLLTTYIPVSVARPSKMKRKRKRSKVMGQKEDPECKTDAKIKCTKML